MEKKICTNKGRNRFESYPLILVGEEKMKVKTNFIMRKFYRISKYPILISKNVKLNFLFYIDYFPISNAKIIQHFTRLMIFY